MDVARDLLIGRIHAMTNVVTLLSESQWQGVKLRGLFSSARDPACRPHRGQRPGYLRQRAGRTVAVAVVLRTGLAFRRGLSLVGKHPHIVANWEVTGEEPDTVFHFRWEEFNTSAATRREDSDFGLILLDRVAPEAMGGTASATSPK